MVVVIKKVLGDNFANEVKEKSSIILKNVSSMEQQALASTGLFTSSRDLIDAFNRNDREAAVKIGQSAMKSLGLDYFVVTGLNGDEAGRCGTRHDGSDLVEGQSALAGCDSIEPDGGCANVKICPGDDHTRTAWPARRIKAVNSGKNGEIGRRWSRAGWSKHPDTAGRRALRYGHDHAGVAANLEGGVHTAQRHSGSAKEIFSAHQYVCSSAPGRRAETCYCRVRMKQIGSGRGSLRATHRNGSSGHVRRRKRPDAAIRLHVKAGCGNSIEKYRVRSSEVRSGNCHLR